MVGLPSMGVARSTVNWMCGLTALRYVPHSNWRQLLWTPCLNPVAVYFLFTSSCFVNSLLELKDRTQFVRIGGTSSSVQELICGVPQGSVLGPLRLEISSASMVCSSIYTQMTSNYIPPSTLRMQRGWLRQRDESRCVFLTSILGWL